MPAPICVRIRRLIASRRPGCNRMWKMFRLQLYWRRAESRSCLKHRRGGQNHGVLNPVSRASHGRSALARGTGRPAWTVRGSQSP